MTETSRDSPLQPSTAATAIEKVTRESWGAVLSLLTSRLRDIQFAEDMLQAAILSALTSWTVRGVPDNPQGWLFRVAMNGAIDQARRFNKDDSHHQRLAIYNELASSTEVPDMDATIPDERLRMIFTCCHPAIAQPAQVALTLRTLCGLQTSEIARAFLVPETTMAQRLVRVKKKIRNTGIPYQVPDNPALPERLDAVLSVLYLIFNEGYYSSADDSLIRTDLCDEALYLIGELCQLLPDQPEALGLRALMTLHDSRRAARVDQQRLPVMLPDQDRSLWDKELIQQGMQYLTQASSFQQTGPYQLQAAISAVHATAKQASDTNWPAIVTIYDTLYLHMPSLVVALNQAVAVSFAESPHRGLERLIAIGRDKALIEKLSSYQPYYAALADIHSRLGNRQAASAAYRRAIELSTNEQEKSYLSRKLEGIDNQPEGPE